jgi:hypothetical protein
MNYEMSYENFKSFDGGVTTALILLFFSLSIYLFLNFLPLLLLLIPFVLGPLAYFPSELIWNNGSYRQSVGLLGQGISPVSRPLPTGDNTNTEEKQTSVPRVGLEPTIPVFK